MGKIVDTIVHLDRHVGDLVRAYGAWSYAILFGIIFAETGFIVVPFLPGDSLLFVVGILAGRETHLDVVALFGLLTLAAIIGDQVNFRIGRIFGMRLYRNPKSKIFRPQHLEMTHEFYAKYGHKTVLLARFVPIVRALSPFVAGMSGMPYRDFCAWSVGGATLWISVCLFGGYFFGQIPVVRQHFDLGLLVIVFFSVVPAIVEYVKHWSRRRKAASE
jgi:membrane-associated protein